MNKKIKLQISSDIEDVTRVTSVLLDEALIHINDLVNLINTSKTVLREMDISSAEELQKLSSVLEMLNTTRLPMNKIDNRLADVVAVVDGLSKILNNASEISNEKKEEEKNDNISAG